MLRVPSLDVEFVRRWSPARFAALGLAIYGVLLLTSPLEYDFSKLSWQAIAYAAACQLAFFGGCYIVNGLDRRATPIAVQPVSLPADRMINITLVLGLVGVLSRFYDRVIARGFTITEDLLENRETISEGLTSFAYIGGLFFSFGLIAITLMWLTGAHRRRPYSFALASVLALYPMFETLVQGSRSTMIHTLVLLFLCARSANAMRWLVRSKLALLLCGVVVLLVAEAVYQMRTFASGFDTQDMVDIFMLTAISDYARPSQWVVDVLVSTNGVGLLGGAVKAWTHVSQYLTHSWLAYCDNYNAFEGILGYGRYHLFLLMRFLSVLAGEDVYFDPTSYGMISGISTTGFTSLLYDFGMGGPLVAAIYGFVATTVQRWAIQVPERWLPLYMYLCFACLMHMVDNIFLGGLGAFAIWTFTGYAGFHYLVTVLADSGSRITPTGLSAPPAEPPGLGASPQ
jgi:hypothetical protein